VVQTSETSRSLLGGTEPVIYYDTSYSLATCPSIDAGCRTNLAPPPPTLPDARLYFPRSVWLASEGTPFRQSSLRAYLVAPGGSKETIAGWYDRTLSSNGWFEVASIPANLEYRNVHGETLIVTFTPGQAQFGYAVIGLTYTVFHSIPTCAVPPLPRCR
jgi:hypothetical protein